MAVRKRLSVALLAAALWSSGIAGGQTKPEPPAQGSSFGESIEVNVVNIDVYVTDKTGKRVRGLTRDDFEIAEDGRPVKITNFYAMNEGRLTSGSGDAAAPGPRPEVAAAIAAAAAGASPGTAIPEDQRLHVVVYIDNLNIRPFNRNRVFRALREFLQQRVGSSDRVMLVTYERSLHVRHSFTSDALAVAGTLFELETLSGYGVHADSDRKDVLQRIKDTDDAASAIGSARTYAESVRNDLTFTLGALKETIGSLAGLPGRKALLYVSDGIPQVPGEDVFYAIEDKFPNSGAIMEARSYDASRQLQELAAQANASRVSFYTIDASGLRVSSSVNADQQQPLANARVDSADIANLQAPLQLLADQTGGKAIFNSNDVAPALLAATEDFSSYYSLGYTPAHPGTGRYHRVDVRVKRKGLLVRHRDGYRDKSPETSMSEGVMASLYFDYASNPFDLIIDATEQRPRDDGNYLVTVKVRVPIGKLVLLPEGDRHTAHARLFVAAMDSDGGTSDVQHVPLPLAVPAPELAVAQTKSFEYSLPLIMRSGNHKVAVGVRDDLAANASFAVTFFTVGAGRER